ncbi:MAG: hypothetical protein H0U52_03705 [Chloroflexi bacterium]|nr:hypothetical protein [Chloroflexota bacterium]
MGSNPIFGTSACTFAARSRSKDRTQGATTIAPASITDLLGAWRAAERRWERPASDDDVRAAALDVIRAWTAYQDAALGDGPSEFMLVADDAGVYVAATSGVDACLGYRPDTLIGMKISDLAAAELLESTPAKWAAFLAAGRQDGRFRLRGIDGRIVNLRYQARAHHPVPGYHLSRLWPEQPGSIEGTSSTAETPLSARPERLR